MEEQQIEYDFRLQRGTSLAWARRNPVLDAGEQGYETDTRRYKIGDGVSRWNQLEYYLPASALRELIDEALRDVGAGDYSVSEVEFVAHIQSPNPHPAYDDGPDLVLLYENAKA